MQNTVKQYKAILAKRNALSHAMGGDYGNIERGKLQIAGE